MFYCTSCVQIVDLEISQEVLIAPVKQAQQPMIHAEDTKGAFDMIVSMPGPVVAAVWTACLEEQEFNTSHPKIRKSIRIVLGALAVDIRPHRQQTPLAIVKGHISDGISI